MVSIFTGAAAGASVSIIIKAVDQYSNQFRKLDKTLDQQDSAFKKLGNRLSSIGLGYAALAGAAIAFGVDAVKTALRSEAAFQQFNLALGDTADIMLNDLRKASRGLVSNLDLVNAANRALALGISQNQLPQLMETAAARARIFGSTVTDAFNDITIGIGRQSRMILDNLGIILDLDTAYKAYAEELGITVEALTEVQKKEALTNAVLKESENLVKANSLLIESHSEKLQRLSAGWKNAKDAIGSFLIDAGDTIVFLQKMQYSIEGLTQDDLPAFMRSLNPTSQAITKLSNEAKQAQDNLNEIKNALRGIKDVQFVGEAEKNVDITKQQNRVDELNLELIKAKGTAAEETIQTELTAAEDKLRALELERKITFNNIRDIEQAKANAFLAEQLGTEITKDTFLQSIEAKKAGWKTEQDAIIGVQNEIDTLIKKYEESARARNNAGVSGGGGGSSGGSKTSGSSVSSGGTSSSPSTFSKIIDTIFNNPFNKIFGIGDAIIRPNGDVIKTHPKDTLIATKNPGGMGGIIINIESVNGIDAEEISRALVNELNNKVSL